jgi:hypothetical protein
MSKMLKASVLLNLALAGCLLVLVGRRNSTLPSTAADNPLAKPPLSAETPSPSEKTFHWSEIESEDYRQYLANLRRIGCPEQTIRDIITTDVDSLYADRRLELAKHFSTKELERKIRALRDEETWVVATLFGEKEASDRASASTSVPGRLQRNRERERPVVMPLVFQEVDLAKLKLNHEQVEAITDLRQRFVDEIGGAEQDPSDPAYGERWRKSQPEIDNDLRGMIGVAAFQDYQLEAADSETAPHRAVQTTEER